MYLKANCCEKKIKDSLRVDGLASVEMKMGFTI